MKNLSILFLFLFIASPFLFSDQTGYASWYGGKFQGRKTANGEIFDTYKFTAAHKTLPFDTIIRVKNLENGKTTVVRINDRGPFVKGRIIDLSYAAAKEIGMIESGVAKVSLDIIEGDANKAQKYVYKIQVGAFSNVKNAQNTISRLNSNGLNPTMEKSENGIFRVVLADVKENDIAKYKEMLKKSGVTDYVLKKEIKL
ncbi:MAG: septal ring lytic transglycosylase RlpA family protein [Spirochaetaceae bacterium]|nr:septal ring lytic transglycosylase RlpA family protein [Spirochaetaceae bacterium]